MYCTLKIQWSTLRSAHSLPEIQGTDSQIGAFLFHVLLMYLYFML